MEQGDGALGFQREIYWMGEQAEMWLDSVDRTITEPVHFDSVTRTIAALEEVAARKRSQIRVEPAAIWWRSVKNGI